MRAENEPESKKFKNREHQRKKMSNVVWTLTKSCVYVGGHHHQQ